VHRGETTSDGTERREYGVRRNFRRSRRASDVVAERTPLESLLEDMRDLRLTLAADLNAAAGAAEHGADAIAADIVEADRLELARFARVADQRLHRLQRLATAGPEAPKWRRRVVVALPVVPVVGAMALSAAAATGVLPVPGGADDRQQSAVAASQSPSADTTINSLAELVDVIDNNPSASQVIAAASQLHREIRDLMASSTNDPSQVSKLADLIRMEQSLLLRAQPPGVDVVLDASRKLAARLVPTSTNHIDPTHVPDLAPTVDARPDDDKPDTKSSPEPKKTTTSPKPTSSPTSAPTESPSTPDDDPLPHLPE
jgi:hypothetical protein